MKLFNLQGQVVLAEVYVNLPLLDHGVHVASRVRSSYFASKVQTMADCFMDVLNHKDRGVIISNGQMILWPFQLAL